MNKENSIKENRIIFVIDCYEHGGKYVLIPKEIMSYLEAIQALYLPTLSEPQYFPYNYPKAILAFPISKIPEDLKNICLDDFPIPFIQILNKLVLLRLYLVFEIDFLLFDASFEITNGFDFLFKNSHLLYVPYLKFNLQYNLVVRMCVTFDLIH